MEKKRAMVKMVYWETGDTCPSCCHDGMTFTMDDYQDVPGYYRGVLSCPDCGAWDDCCMVKIEDLEDLEGE